MSLEQFNLGEILYSLRTYKGIDVKGLAEGICSEEELILFEKEKKYPSLEQLASFADKLNVDLSYFFEFTQSSLFNYGAAIFKLIENFKRERNYQSIYEIVQKEKNNPLFFHIPKKQFLMWHEGISLFYLYNKKEEAVELLREAIKLSNPDMINLTEREADILTSLAIIEKDDKNYEKAADLFLEALEHLENVPYVFEPKIKIKLLYALSQVLTKLGRYQDSLTYCEKGIKECIANEMFYQFADFHYQMGENKIRLGEVDKGREYIEKSATIFELQGNKAYAQLVKNELENLFLELSIKNKI